MKVDRLVDFYSVLLRFFPRAYREENEADLIDFFRQRCAERARVGPRALVAYLLRASWDVIREGLAERFGPSTRAPKPLAGRSIMSGLGKDIAHAFRGLRRAPAWAALIVITMGVGIGATTAIFTMFDVVLLRPLPFSDPDRLVWIETYRSEAGGRGEAGEGGRSNLADFTDWRRAATRFSGMAASNNDVLTITVRDESERVSVASVSPEYFGVLGVTPTLGRSFVPGDGVFGNHRVVILRHDFWVSRFGSDSSVIGGLLQIEGEPFAIVGVMPAGWPGAWSDAAVWRPMAFAADDWRVADRVSRWMDGAVGRLRPGVSLEVANAELRAIGTRLSREYRESNRDVGVRAEWLRTAFTADTRTPLRALLGAVGLLLLIGCVNVASMLLARATAREREVAVRRALGASRLRLARLSLIESLMLGLSGGGLGIVLAWWLMTPATLLAGERFLGLGAPRLDARVLVFALLVAVATTLIFGLAPILHALRGDIQDALREGRAAASSRRTHRSLRLLTIAETALAVVLLTGAGLLIRSFEQQTRVDLGFEAGGVLAFRASVLDSRYESDTTRLDFFDRLRARIDAMPGIESVAITYTETPLAGGSWYTNFGVGGRPVPASRADWPSIRFGTVSGDYFATLGIRVVRGRALTAEDDRPGAPRVAVISERLARRFFPGEDPTGQRLWLFGPNDMTPTIVGVVADMRAEGITRDPAEAVYVPTSQTTHGVASTQWVLLRTTGDPATLTTAVRSAVRELDASAAIDRMEPMTQVARVALAPARVNSILVALFAVLALLLAAIGLYGVMSYNVARQRRDIGVRMALGSRPRDAVRLVLRNALTTVTTGTAIGILAAVWLGRMLSGLLFDVQPFDPYTLLGVAITLLLVTLVASFIPARNAARVAPVEAMRSS